MSDRERTINAAHACFPIQALLNNNPETLFLPCMHTYTQYVHGRFSSIMGLPYPIFFSAHPTNHLHVSLLSNTLSIFRWFITPLSLSLSTHRLFSVSYCVLLRLLVVGCWHCNVLLIPVCSIQFLSKFPFFVLPFFRPDFSSSSALFSKPF